ncbi:MAG: FAD binding domain-containing protein [Elusimicrobiaceae bacterium]|nr:FAD binding domain-containing protein [Elusimicrobiaceae bacterium]
MSKITSYTRPAGAKEAVGVLARFKGRAVIFGGGTGLVKSLPSGVTAVADLKYAGLSYIKRDSKFLTIGACTTFTDLLQSPVIRNWAGGLVYEAAYRISSHLIRNMGTLGGNMVRPYPFNHFPVVLAALNASAVVARPGKTETVPVEKLFEKPYAEELGRKWVLVEFKIPAGTEKFSGVFDKVAKTESSWENIMLCAAVLEHKGGVCRSLRVALGAAVAKATVLPAAEAVLAGKKITAELACEAGGKAAAQAGQFNSLSAPAQYKKEIAPVVIRRCILAAAGQGAR